MINTLAEFKDFLKICRKEGVTEVKTDKMSVTFGDTPARQKRSESDDEVQTDEPTLEQLAFYSAGPPST